MKKYLLLWEIDGTLIDTSSLGIQPNIRVIDRLYGVEPSLKGLDHRGRTDMYISHSILKAHGIEIIDQNIQAYVDAYLEALESLLPSVSTCVLPVITKSDKNN